MQGGWWPTGGWVRSVAEEEGETSVRPGQSEGAAAAAAAAVVGETSRAAEGRGARRLGQSKAWAGRPTGASGESDTGEPRRHRGERQGWPRPGSNLTLSSNPHPPGIEPLGRSPDPAPSTRAGAFCVGLGVVGWTWSPPLRVCLSVPPRPPAHPPPPPSPRPPRQQPTNRTGKGHDGPTNIGLPAHPAHHHEPVFWSRIGVRLQQRWPRWRWSNTYLPILPFLSGLPAIQCPPPGERNGWRGREGERRKTGLGQGGHHLSGCASSQPARRGS